MRFTSNLLSSNEIFTWQSFWRLGKALDGWASTGLKFETYINSINRIDRLYIRHLRVIRLLTISKDFGDLVRLRLKLLLIVLGCSLKKAFDNWMAIALGYQQLYK